MRSAPTPYNGNLYVGCTDWNLYCFTQATQMTIQTTSITFELRPSSISLGDIVTVAGSVNGVSSQVPIYVYFSKGDSSLPINITAVTDTNGGFTVKYTPDMIGDWTIAVSYVGDATHAASNGQSQTLTVTKLATQTPQPTSVADLYFIPSVISIIVVIIAIGVVILVVLKKQARP